MTPVEDFMYLLNSVLLGEEPVSIIGIQHIFRKLTFYNLKTSKKLITCVANHYICDCQ